MTKLIIKILNHKEDIQPSEVITIESKSELSSECLPREQHESIEIDGVGYKCQIIDRTYVLTYYPVDGQTLSYQKINANIEQYKKYFESLNCTIISKPFHSATAAPYFTPESSESIFKPAALCSTAAFSESETSLDLQAELDSDVNPSGDTLSPSMMTAFGSSSSSRQSCLDPSAAQAAFGYAPYGLPYYSNGSRASSDDTLCSALRSENPDELCAAGDLFRARIPASAIILYEKAANPPINSSKAQFELGMLLCCDKSIGGDAVKNLNDGVTYICNAISAGNQDAKVWFSAARRRNDRLANMVSSLMYDATSASPSFPMPAPSLTASETAPSTALPASSSAASSSSMFASATSAPSSSAQGSFGFIPQPRPSSVAAGQFERHKPLVASQFNHVEPPEQVLTSVSDSSLIPSPQNSDASTAQNTHAVSGQLLSSFPSFAPPELTQHPVNTGLQVDTFSAASSSSMLASATSAPSSSAQGSFGFIPQPRPSSVAAGQSGRHKPLVASQFNHVEPPEQTLTSTPESLLIPSFQTGTDTSTASNTRAASSQLSSSYPSFVPPMLTQYPVNNDLHVDTFSAASCSSTFSSATTTSSSSSSSPESTVTAFRNSPSIRLSPTQSALLPRTPTASVLPAALKKQQVTTQDVPLPRTRVNPQQQQQQQQQRQQSTSVPPQPILPRVNNDLPYDIPAASISSMLASTTTTSSSSSSLPGGMVNAPRSTAQLAAPQFLQSVQSGVLPENSTPSDPIAVPKDKKDMVQVIQQQQQQQQQQKPPSVPPQSISLPVNNDLPASSFSAASSSSMLASTTTASSSSSSLSESMAGAPGSTAQLVARQVLQPAQPGLLHEISTAPDSPVVQKDKEEDAEQKQQQQQQQRIDKEDEKHTRSGEDDQEGGSDEEVDKQNLDGKVSKAKDTTSHQQTDRQDAEAKKVDTAKTKPEEFDAFDALYDAQQPPSHNSFAMSILQNVDLLGLVGAVTPGTICASSGSLSLTHDDKSAPSETGLPLTSSALSSSTDPRQSSNSTGKGSLTPPTGLPPLPSLAASVSSSSTATSANPDELCKTAKQLLQEVIKLYRKAAGLNSREAQDMLRQLWPILGMRPQQPEQAQTRPSFSIPPQLSTSMLPSQTQTVLVPSSSSVSQTQTSSSASITAPAALSSSMPSSSSFVTPPTSCTSLISPPTMPVSLASNSAALFGRSALPRPHDLFHQTQATKQITGEKPLYRSSQEWHGLIKQSKQGDPKAYLRLGEIALEHNDFEMSRACLRKACEVAHSSSEHDTFSRATVLLSNPNLKGDGTEALARATTSDSDSRFLSSSHT